MKEKLPGNASCSRINHDNTRATNPMLMAVMRVLNGDDFGILAKDVLRHPALRMVKLYVFDFGRRDDFGCANVDHRMFSSLLACQLR